VGTKTLKEADEEVYNLIAKERQRQIRGLELIASEVGRVRDCGSAGVTEEEGGDGTELYFSSCHGGSWLVLDQ